MNTNYNNPHGAFLNQTGPASTNTTCNSCCCSWWNSDFAGNLATALGSVGSAALSKNKPAAAPKPAAAAPKPVTPVAATATSTKVLYWSLGIVAVAGVIGVVVYVAKKP